MLFIVLAQSIRRTKIKNFVSQTTARKCALERAAFIQPRCAFSKFYALGEEKPRKKIWSLIYCQAGFLRRGDRAQRERK